MFVLIHKQIKRSNYCHDTLTANVDDDVIYNFGNRRLYSVIQEMYKKTKRERKIVIFTLK